MNNKELMINLKEVLVGLLVMIFLISCAYIPFTLINKLNNIEDRLDRANVEYQFVVTDDSLTVYDNNRVVGTVKIEGQLDSLIIADNK